MSYGKIYGEVVFEEIKNERFDEREVGVLNFWREKEIFQKSVEQRKGAKLFSFYDGPPFATGLPHYGHYLAGTIKDVVLRFKTMEGYYVPRRFGWDCHGLPIEQEIEKSFNLSGAHSIEEFGIGRFNEECRKIVLRYTEEWKTLVGRMGRWVDFSQTYRTMDTSFMESVWWVFKQLYTNGLVYKGYKVMPYSAKLGTPLSNFEAGENYKEVDDPSLTVTLQTVEDPNLYFLAWTTTPWTLVSNLALMAGPNIDYVKIADLPSGKKFILAKSRLASYYKIEEEYEILEEFKGLELEGKGYQPILPYFAEEKEKGAFRIILEESVSTEDGTGIVHCAPAFGEVDFYACKKEGIQLVCPVDGNGIFTDEVPDYTGKFVKDADKEIIRRLKEEGKIVQQGTIRHRYPFCWRSDTPLIYKAVSTWFVAVEKIKELLLSANQQIHWTPGHLKDGRFGKWLENARDWAISRNRYWGTPIPIWMADDGDILVLGSLQELKELTGEEVQDLHRHFIDGLSIMKDGKEFHRIPEVFDCWFESGSMPYAQSHYPFENQSLFDEGFPADFIGEGLDQTRGWFYTLTILSAALFGKPAFKSVVVNGIVLASDGSKMSKRLKNYPDPTLVVHKYGADAVRLYMMHSPAVRGDDLCFQEHGVELVLRQILIPLWNAYSFFITYARIYDWKPAKEFSPPQSAIDKWVLSLLNKLNKEVRDGMDEYDLSKAVEPFVEFIDQLTNWYIRRSRRRFWNEEDSPERSQAFQTLYRVLLDLTKIAAPFVPFISEKIYLNLRDESMPASVHLCDYPAYEFALREELLEDEMEAVQRAVSLGHALRKEHKLKVRQPLPLAHIASGNENVLRFLKDQQGLIAEELNVKELSFEHGEHQFVSLKAKPNFRVLGKKVGKLMRGVQKAIDGLAQEQLQRLLNGETIELGVEGEKVSVDSEDVQVERVVKEGLIAANEGTLTIALETSLSEELLQEGLAREIVNKVNTMRKEAGLAVTDRISLKLQTTDKVKDCFEGFHNYICGETLAEEVHFEECVGEVWDLNGETAVIAIAKR